MPPKISVIIPVYNVEKYLAKCLDSVIAQTFGDIEVLCVDHSSTDGSLAILQEYASRDNRIKIIPCVNTRGGPGQARNAGLEHAQGKYTYFLDSDDWIDPTLCEKAYNRLEQSGADVVFFVWHEVNENVKTVECRYSPPRFKLSLTNPDFFHILPVPWNRMTKTGFLRKIDFRFPEGILPEDNFLHWALLVHEPKTEVILEKLYFYLRRDDSQTGQRGEYIAKHSQVYTAIKQYLQKIGKYEQYREKLLVKKYRTFIGYLHLIRRDYMAKHVQWLHETVDEDEIHFLTKEKSLGNATRNVILAFLPGNRAHKWIWQTFRTINRGIIRPIVKPIESLIRYRKSLIKKFRHYEQRIDEFNTLLAQRDKEIVELRSEKVLADIRNTIGEKAQ